MAVLKSASTNATTLRKGRRKRELERLRGLVRLHATEERDRSHASAEDVRERSCVICLIRWEVLRVVRRELPKIDVDGLNERSV
jgi:hypothetical protein